MTLAKKGTKTPEPPKPTPPFLELQKIQKEPCKAEDIERMIEAKVALALRLLH